MEWDGDEQDDTEIYMRVVGAWITCDRTVVVVTEGVDPSL